MRKTKAVVFANCARSCQLSNDSSFRCENGKQGHACELAMRSVFAATPNSAFQPGDRFSRNYMNFMPLDASSTQYL